MSTLPAPCSPSTARLWLLDGNRLPPARLLALAAALGPSERQRHDSFRRVQRAREFLLARVLLRHAVGQTLDIPDSVIHISERKGNAPLLTLPAPYSGAGLHFSLSHSRGWIACVISSACPLGLDIEDRHHPRDIAALSAAMLDEEEMHWLNQQAAAERPSAFYRLWGCREAISKLRGNQEDANTNEGRDNDRDNDCGSGWNCQTIAHARLAICLCSAAELSGVEVCELGGM